MGSEPAWLEVSLTVDGETAEAVAEVLARHAPNGVVIESTAVSVGKEGEGLPHGPVRVAGYLPVNDALEATRRKLEEALYYLGRIQPVPPPAFRWIPDADWTQTWKRRYRPIKVGRRLLIVPAWLRPEPGERIPVYIEPGMAFGSGAHPSTRLSLELGEEGIVPGEPMIDLGCGSGILAIAALKLGAGRALGVDTDPQAVSVARTNAELNGVADRLELGVGSVQEISRGDYGLRRAPLVQANLLAPVIIRLLEEGLAGLLSAGGALVLSGILDEQGEEVRAALGARRLEVRRRCQMGDWLAFVARPG